jgi:hypothetical protein
MLNARCVATGDPLHVLPTTLWCTLKRHVHRCSTTRSPPEAMPLSNRGVLSAAPCTTITITTTNTNTNATTTATTTTRKSCDYCFKIVPGPNLHLFSTQRKSC